MIKDIIKSLKLPKNEILFLHVRLRGLGSNEKYSLLSKNIINYLEDFYTPQTILVPTFTYSFTKTGLYDRVNTVSEVGRFGEEIRLAYPIENRTMNPVFNVLDSANYLGSIRFNDFSAFGKGSMLDYLAKKNYIIININLPEIINTHLHYLEYINRVDYRFEKNFNGKISKNGIDFKDIKYNYYVRNLDMDTKWRRSKIERYLLENKCLNLLNYNNMKFSWIFSNSMDNSINKILEYNKRYLITD